MSADPKLGDHQFYVRANRKQRTTGLKVHVMGEAGACMIQFHKNDFNNTFCVQGKRKRRTTKKSKQTVTSSASSPVSSHHDSLLDKPNKIAPPSQIVHNNHLNFDHHVQQHHQVHNHAHHHQYSHIVPHSLQGMPIIPSGVHYQPAPLQFVQSSSSHPSSPVQNLQLPSFNELSAEQQRKKVSIKDLLN